MDGASGLLIPILICFADQIPGTREDDEAKTGSSDVALGPSPELGALYIAMKKTQSV